MNTVQEILSWYPDMTSAQKKNLARMLNFGRLGGTGKLMILPIDQGLEHGPGRSFEINPAMYDPIQQIDLALQGGFSAFSAPMGTLERASEYIASTGLPTILKINSHNLMMNDEKDPAQSLTSWVDDALRLGCEGIGFTLYPGSAMNMSSVEELRKAIAQARKAGLVVVTWVYARGSGILPRKETAVDILAYGVQWALAMGAHIVKCKLPASEGYGLDSNAQRNIYTPESMSTLQKRVELIMKSAFNGKRIVINSGGDKKDDEAIFEEVRALRDGGSFGTIMGRNSFQRPLDQALPFIHKVQDILAGKE